MPSTIKTLVKANFDQEKYHLPHDLPAWIPVRYIYGPNTFIRYALDGFRWCFNRRGDKKRGVDNYHPVYFYAVIFR